MNDVTNSFLPGNLVTARGRTWVVQTGSEDDWLKLRPLGGADDEETELDPSLELTPVTTATFPMPNPEDAGAWTSARLLYDGLRLQLRSGAGPFRSFASIAVEPRPYQLVPLMMAMRMQVVRLLIADDVGIGKTIESGMIVREMMDRGDIETLAVLCPPHLVDQWTSELSERFNIPSAALTAASAAKLERDLPHGMTLFDFYPVLVVSLDYIKTERHRQNFLIMDPDCIIVDEAHTCTNAGRKSQQRYNLLKELSYKPDRHLIMLTATPHSGNENAFYSLLSLIDDKYKELQGITTKTGNRLREELAQHFIQRRRIDIDEWQRQGNGSPSGFPERLVSEATYKMNNEWANFFDLVQDYCRGLADRKDADKAHPQSLIWYVILALFRCISSSPAAAYAALNGRLERLIESQNGEEGMTEAELQELRASLVGDGDEELSETVDITPNARMEDTKDLDTLVQWAKELLDKPENDPKLRLLVTHVRKMLDGGFNPVIFCRYIATARYVADHLTKAFAKTKGVTVESVSGELSPDERREKVEALIESDKRILVATDCLSEGINLQDGFSAVIHYDLSWNPTRHEQREGRVDRFGQRAKKVRCLMIYGQDNPVDGFILRVILAKSRTIKEKLGITVPVPEDETLINNALIKAALFKRDKASAQQSFDFDEEVSEQIDVTWKNQLENIKKSRTIFAQKSLHPEDVWPLWEKQQQALGSHQDTATFCRDGTACLGCRLEPTNRDEIYTLPINTFDEATRLRLSEEQITDGQLVDMHTLQRSNPLISVISESLVNLAIKGSSNFISRSAVATSDAVQRITRIYLLRLRYQMRLVKRNTTTRFVMAEEVYPIGLQRNKGQWEQLPTDETIRLLNATTSSNLDRATSVGQVRDAIDWLEDPANPLLNETAQTRSQVLLEDHKSVNDFTSSGRVRDVSPCLPVDVMGVFILLPNDD